MKKAKIIVLSGQSNAVGVGHLKCLKRSFPEEKIADYYKGYERVKIWYYSHDKKNEGFMPTTVNCTELHKDTLGPEVGMAEYLSEQFPEEEFYIVKFAVGGASLKRDFLPPSAGGYYDVERFKKEYSAFLETFFSGEHPKFGWCYNGLVDHLRDCLTSLRKQGLTPEILGFCWMQGESDAAKPEQVELYRRNFDLFVKDLKREFPSELERCVFVDAAIGEIWKYYKELNLFKKEYAQNHPNFVFLDTVAEGFCTKHEPEEEPDTAHYDCESVIRLGKRFVQCIQSRREL